MTQLRITVFPINGSCVFPVARLFRAIASSMMLAAAAAQSGLAFSQVISTVAGGGSPDGYGAISISMPHGNIAFDPSGNLYASVNSRIVKVAQGGTFITVAGNGAWGYAAYGGDGGPAIDAALSSTDFCIDMNGNLYIADAFNFRIRKVSPDGRISTMAGNGTSGYSGDGGPAGNAQVFSPGGIVVSAIGDLYFFDSVSIRKISSAGIISTIAKWTVTGFGGDGGSAMLAMLNEPRGLTADVLGNVYVADMRNHRIRKIGADGILSTVAGNGSAGFGGDGGPATSAALNFPVAVTVDAAGNLYIADSLNHRIRRVAPNGTISTIAGTGAKGFAGDGAAAVAAQLDTPYYLAIDAVGDLHFNDSGNGRIRKVTKSGTIRTVAGAGLPFFVGDGNPATNAFLALPQNLTVDAAGNLYVVDAANSRIRKISPNGRVWTVAGNGSYGFSGDGGDATNASLMSPVATILDAAGNLYIVDSERVRKVTPGGVISTVAGGGPPFNNGDGIPAIEARLNSPSSLAFDAAGNLFIGCSLSIRKVMPNGIISTVAGDGAWGFGGDGGPASLARITAITGMTFDAQGNLYVADSGNARIRRIAPNGIISTIAGNGTVGFAGDTGPATAAQINLASGNMAVDPGGSLYFADAGNHRIRKISPNGIISTIVGSGEPGFAGDGGAAASARLNHPSGVALDANGDLYVGDRFNNRIRKVSTRGGANYSDMWWSGSLENGWGMSIQQHVSGVQFNALYVYDNGGQPRWYVMPGGAWRDGFTTYAGPLYQPTGSALNGYESAAFAPGAPVGSATIRFIGNLVADLTYTIEGITGSKRLVRMSFGGSNAMHDVGDMWWGGNSQNGWGISIAQQGGTLFSVWYTYGMDGKSQWFTMPGGSWNDSHYSGPFYTTTGSRWLGATYDPSVFRVEQVGTMNLNFSNPDAAILSYAFSSGQFADTNQTKIITRMSY